jgi:predicted acyl esterase
MIQIHSTWFPYIDRNPQKYVDNIYMADESDFIKSTITVHGGSAVDAGGKVGIPAQTELQLEQGIKD